MFNHPKEFFEGELVVVELSTERARQPEHVPTRIGKITQVYQINHRFEGYTIACNGRNCTFLLVDSGSKGNFYEGSPHHGLPCISQCNLRRMPLEELTAGFDKALSNEMELVRQLAETQDETHRAATLQTLRNLTHYLSPEIGVACNETEGLARASDEIGRAAALATLRNLNAYLGNRNQAGTPSSA